MNRLEPSALKYNGPSLFPFQNPSFHAGQLSFQRLDSLHYDLWGNNLSLYEHTHP